MKAVMQHDTTMPTRASGTRIKRSRAKFMRICSQIYIFGLSF